MKSLIVPIIFLTLILIGKQVFSCTFSEHSGDVHVAKIFGSEVYTLFTRHIMEEYAQEILGTFSLPSNEQVKALNDILQKRKRIIQSEQSDVRQITKLVQSGEIRWIGVEATPGELHRMGTEVRVNDYLEMKRLFNHMGHMEGWDKQKTDQILYLMYSPDIIARVENPEVFKAIPTVPIDDEQAKQEMFNVREKRDQHKDILMNIYDQLCFKKKTHQPSWCRPLASFCFVEKKICMKIKRVPNDELTEFLNQNKIENENAKASMVALAELNNKFLDLSDRRDEKAASIILNKSGNGLVTMGSAHGPGIESRLATACKNKGSETKTETNDPADSFL